MTDRPETNPGPSGEDKTAKASAKSGKALRIGAAVGIGSAAIVAALLYARSSGKKSD